MMHLTEQIYNKMFEKYQNITSEVNKPNIDIVSYDRYSKVVMHHLKFS